MPTYSLEGPKWTSQVITWSFADPSLPNSGTFSAAIGASYKALFRQAIQHWDDQVSLTFKEVADGTPNVDLRLGFGLFGMGGQIGQADYSYSTGNNPGDPDSFLPGVTVRLEDPVQRAISTSTGTAIYSGTQTSVYQVALHEIGHAIGLGHDSDPTAVMYSTSSASNRDFSASDLAGIRALYTAPSFLQTDTVTNVSSRPDGTAYTGPVSYLQHEYIYGGTNGVAVVATDPNVFVKGGSGDDAITVSSGRNVLDGGTGSNFLTGGTGNDTFFVDGRGGQVTWGTLVNFHAGDAVTLWGFDPAISTRSWSANEGAAGYQGATLHADLNHGGSVNASITFAGLTSADVARFGITSGTVGGSTYLQITNPG